MLKTRIKSRQNGFTVPELLLMVVIIIVLAGLVMTYYQSARAKERDTQRVKDVNLIHNRLETYFNENNAYPAAFTASDLFGIDAEALKDPNGRSIDIHAPVIDSTAAQAVPNPTNGNRPSYLYVPYPQDCTNANKNCSGFVLKTYIEKQTGTTPNPYAKVGINNN